MADELQARTLRRISLRIVPFIMLLYFVAFIDRVNIGFASLTMNKDLGFTASVFGFGAGIFFWGYFLFEVPSNIILDKVGARLWIARVMITWGIVSAAMAFVQGQTSFYILRFLDTEIIHRSVVLPRPGVISELYLDGGVTEELHFLPDLVENPFEPWDRAIERDDFDAPAPLKASPMPFER